MEHSILDTTQLLYSYAELHFFDFYCHIQQANESANDGQPMCEHLPAYSVFLEYSIGDEHIPF